MTWFSIAKTQYRVSTCRIREIRSILPYLLVGGLAFFIFILAPMIADFYIDDFQAMILSQVAVVLVQVFLFYFFILFASLPITSTLQDIKTGQLEIVLSAPVKPGSLLIGEFVGKLPFYATFAAIIGGLFTAALFPLGLDIFQVTIIIIIFIVNFLSATWIGTLTAVLLRSVLMKSARGRDIGKGLAIIIVLPLVAILYAFMGGYMEALKDPAIGKVVHDILSFFPSSWGSEVIVAFAQNPGDIFSIEFLTVVQFSGLIFFFILALWIGGFVANRAYNLEPSSFSASKVKSKRYFYSIVRKLGGGGSFGVLLATGFKNYFRKIKNITMLAYAVGLVLMISVFLLQPDDLEMAFMSCFIAGPLLAVFVASEITLQGKENLLLYKSSPMGTVQFLKTKLYQYFLTILPIVAILASFAALRVPGIVLDGFLFNVLLIVLIAAGATIFTMGLFLLNPAYHDKDPSYMINIQIVVFVLIIPFMLSLILFGTFFRDSFKMIFGDQDPFFPSAIVLTAFAWIFGIFLLALGTKKLNNLE